MPNRRLLLAAVLPIALGAQELNMAPAVLPPRATTALAAAVKAAAAHAKHVWRDTPPINSDGTVNGYIEIARGDRRKWEFDIGANKRAIDRMIPQDIGGYPVNYGFVPQTVSYDGDPFDVLVLGPPLAGGELVRGVAVAVMFMEDEKGLDSKVVISTVDGGGRPRYQLTAERQREMTDFFRRYRRDLPAAFSKVPGWGPASAGLSLVRRTHAFYQQCQGRAGTPCALPTP
jgi:inorganic pyrophosphatase